MKTDLSQQRVNYDTIAHLYDEPIRDHAVDENLAQFLAARPSYHPLLVLDMGCGTGKQLAANRPHFPGAVMVGMDLFAGMLRQAQRRGQGVCWVQADNIAAPFAGGSFHYITNQFSYPHVQNKLRFFAETVRLLKPDGRFVLTNIDPWSMPGWAIYRYFPAAWALDEQDFLPVDRLVVMLEQAGYGRVTFSHRHLAAPTSLADFQAYASARHRTSQFIAMADADYAAGLAAIERDRQQWGDTAVIESEVCLLTIICEKGLY
ncbi:MAG: methyltransferase domain-containing protein [Anaerolineae bacterium]|nr:methyltransferase domain-containing protein [Anaerolineae bacterium]